MKNKDSYAKEYFVELKKLRVFSRRLLSINFINSGTEIKSISEIRENILWINACFSFEKIRGNWGGILDQQIYGWIYCQFPKNLSVNEILIQTNLPTILHTDLSQISATNFPANSAATAVKRVALRLQ